MSIPPILADNLEDLVSALNDRLRKISVPQSAPLEVGLPVKPSSPVPRSWVEANFVSQRSLSEVVREQIFRLAHTTTSRITKSHAIVLSVSGTLAVASAVAPLLLLDEEFPASRIRALLKRPPVGDKLVVAVMAGDAEWGRVEVSDGEVQGHTTVSSGLPAGVVISLDVVQVGSSFPGAGLTLEVT